MDLLNLKLLKDFYVPQIPVCLTKVLVKISHQQENQTRNINLAMILEIFLTLHLELISMTPIVVANILNRHPTTIATRQQALTIRQSLLILSTP